MGTTRAATVGDVTEVARIHVAASRRTERGLIPDAALDAIDVGARERMWRRIVSDGGHPVHVIVAEDRGSIVGFAASGPEPDTDGTGELHAVYVDPPEQGRGHGTALLEAVEDDLRDRGYDEAVLWVLSTNVPTITFYRDRGWRDDLVERVETLHGVDVRELRYRKRLRTGDADGRDRG